MKKLFIVFFMSLISQAFAKDIIVSLGAGDEWKHKMPPQYAIWLEEVDGTFVKTLYVTNKAAKKNWIFGPKEGRPESLPVWYGKTTDSLYDTITSATRKGGMIFEVAIEDKDYVIKVEVNKSFDYNQNFTKNNSGVNGQPSIVYSALVPKSFKDEIKLSLEGTGSLDGNDAFIHKAEGLTTALQIVKCIAVVNKE